MTEHEILGRDEAAPRDQGRGGARGPADPAGGRRAARRERRAEMSAATRSRTGSPRRSSRSTPSSSRASASRTRRTSRSSRTSTCWRADARARTSTGSRTSTLLEEDGVPAVFDRYSNSFIKIYFPIPEGREDELARKVLIKHLHVGQLLRDPAEGRCTASSPSPSSAVGRGLAAPSAPTGSRPCSRAGSAPPGIDDGRGPLVNAPARRRSAGSDAEGSDPCAGLRGSDALGAVALDEQAVAQAAIAHRERLAAGLSQHRPHACRRRRG